MLTMVIYNLKAVYRMFALDFYCKLKSKPISYCLTYNKSQGQTCDRLILDTTYPPFSHAYN